MEQETNKKNNSIVKILTIVLLVTITFIGGLSLGSHLTTKKENQSQQKEETKTEQISTLKVDEIDIIQNKIVQLNALISLGKITDTSIISEKDLLDFAIISLPASEDGTYKLDFINSFLETNLGRKIEKPTNYDVTFATCEYKANANEYNCLGHGGEFYQSFNRLLSIEVKDNIYTIQVKKAINKAQDIGYDTNPYYKNIEDLKENKNVLFKAEVFENGCDYEFKEEPSFMFDKLSNDKLPTYTYTFEKVESNYILKSITY